MYEPPIQDGMDYGRLVVEAWNMTRRHRFLWLLGLLATFSGALSSLISRFLLARLGQPNAADPLAPLVQLFDTFSRPGPLVGAVIALLAAGLLVWLISTVAEGGLIQAAGTLGKGGKMDGRAAWAAGTEQVGRLVALDTVLFLPLFLLLLVVMVGGTAVFVGTVLSIVSGGTMEEVLGPALIASACLGLVACLTLPVTFLTMVFRQLAFRAAVLGGLGVRAAVRQTRELLRRDWGHVLVVVMLTWVLRYLIGIALALILLPISLLDSLPLLLAAGGSDGGLGPLTIVLAVLTTLLVAAVNAILHAYTSTLWTLAYGQWAGGSKAGNSWELMGTQERYS